MSPGWERKDVGEFPTYTDEEYARLKTEDERRRGNRASVQRAVHESHRRGAAAKRPKVVQRKD